MIGKLVQYSSTIHFDGTGVFSRSCILHFKGIDNDVDEEEIFFVFDCLIPILEFKVGNYYDVSFQIFDDDFNVITKISEISKDEVDKK